MYAVVEIGSFQYKVSEGDLIEVNRLDHQSGKTISLDQVLLYADGKDIRIGQPRLKDVKVKVRILDHSLDEKKIAFQYRRRKGYSRKVGHRQKLTALKIEKIEAKEK